MRRRNQGEGARGSCPYKAGSEILTGEDLLGESNLVSVFQRQKEREENIPLC
jgi:hypothetical protein